MAADASDAALVLASVTTAEGERVDLRLADGLVTELAPATGDAGAADGGTDPTTESGATRDLTGWLVLPAAVEPHAHLDKTLTAGTEANDTGDLMGALRAWERYQARFAHDEAVGRALEGIARAVAAGCTTVRSHVDLREPLGLAPLAAVVEARELLASVCDVEIAGLVLDPISDRAGDPTRRLLDAALDAGVDVVGGCPNLDPDPAGCVRALVRAAAESGRRIDLHVDETLDLGATTLQDLAREVVAAGLEGRATASHAVSLGAMTEAVQREVARQLADAGIGVVTLPITNLLLQGRGIRVSQPRGLTALESLEEAGVTVAAGADNVQDPFNPLGRSDPFETAALMMAAGHLSPDAAWESVTRSARTVLDRPPVEVGPGSPADLLLVKAGSLVEAIASAPTDRIVLRRGVVVSEVRTEQVVDPRRSRSGS